MAPLSKPTTTTFDSDSLISISRHLQKEQRKVHFDKFLWEHDVLSLDDYSDKEVRRCWYTKLDRNKMELQRTNVLLRMQTDQPETADCPYRGLTHCTPEGEATMFANISACVNSVCDEQDRQWASGLDNVERLGEASLRCSASSREIAFATARQDAQDAIDCWNKEPHGIADSVKEHKKTKKASTKTRTTTRHNSTKNRVSRAKLTDHCHRNE